MSTLAAALLLAAVLSAGPARQPPPSGEGQAPALAGPSAVPDAVAAALSDEELRAQIDAYLGSIDTPITAGRWRALGPRAAPILAEKATSREAFPSRRARAIEGLAAVGPASQAQLLLQLARSESEPYVVQAAAMRGAAQLLPAAKAVAALRPVLETASSPRIRAAAADALTRSAKAEGCAAVRAQVRREQPEARGHFERALRRCDR